MRKRKFIQPVTQSVLYKDALKATDIKGEVLLNEKDQEIYEIITQLHINCDFDVNEICKHDIIDIECYQDVERTEKITYHLIRFYDTPRSTPCHEWMFEDVEMRNMMVSKFRKITETK